MATAAQPREPRRWRYWLAHQGFTVTAVGFALLYPVAGLSDSRAVTSAATAAAICFGLVNIIEADVHRGLCPVCASRLPVDIGAAAVTHDRALRHYHWMHQVDKPLLRKPGVVIPLAGLAVIVAVSMWLKASLAVNVIDVVLIGGWSCYSTWVYRTHSRLMPWCPYCRHPDSDGDPVVAPRPVPVGEA